MYMSRERETDLPLCVIHVLTLCFSRKLAGKLNTPDTTPPTVPVVKPTFLSSRFSSQSLRATWLGHACYYVEFPSGLRALFDPVFEERCSPFSFFGPKRYTEVPCHIQDLPVVDLVIISHSHYGYTSLEL
jgi:N-acyl-phosphatidylethanolamine-hydrolysing phospholipase D